MMQTYNRSGVHIEQCGHCRRIFLDYGELENLTRLEAGYAAPPPPPPAAPAPAWGAPAPHYRHGHHDQHRGFGKMLCST